MSVCVADNLLTNPIGFLQMDKLQEQYAVELMELVEDTVEYFCTDKLISGETVWAMVEGLATAKINQFPTE